MSQIDVSNYIPKVNPKFVAFGEYDDVKSALASPSSRLNILVSGPKGCGKTQMIQHIMAQEQMPLIRVNITIETDEDSLMGGLRLVDGDTVFEKGPVLRAMEMGCTLLLDEIDLGHPTRLMALQSVLEHEPYHIKKTGELVYPASGFRVICTANTKGRGDDTGQYIGTQILNSAMLDRISLFFDWDYPDADTEKKILTLEAKSYGVQCDKEIVHLVQWAGEIRSGGVQNADTDETISTRKLCDIVSAFAIYKDLVKAVKYSINGMHASTSEAFIGVLTSIVEEDNPDVTVKKARKTFSWNMTD